MELKVFWTQFAENRLDEIFNYYRLQTNERLSRKIINSIIDTTISLVNHPYIGQLEDLLIDRPQNFRYLVFQNYKIIYWINEKRNRIEISNVFDTRQNPVKLKST